MNLSPALLRILFAMNLRSVATWLQEHPQAADLLMVLALALPTVVFQTSLFYDVLPEWVLAAWGMAYIIPLIWRRTHVDTAGVMLLVPHVAQLIGGLHVFNYATAQPLFGNISVLIFMFTAAIYSSRSRLWLGIGLIASFLAGWSWGNALYHMKSFSGGAGEWFLDVGSNMVPCALGVVIAWLFGRLAYHRAENLQIVKLQMAALEREKEQVRKLASEQERSHIARDMHDVIAHSLSVIVVQSDGAKYLLDLQDNVDPKAVEAVGVIGDTARRALTETRRLVGVLRDDSGAEYQPSVRLADLPRLIQTMQQAGLDVSYRETGDPSHHPPLSTGVETAVYRIAQEALTNVMKHAGTDATAVVHLAHTPAGVQIAVIDTGVGHTITDGRGHGIIGMKERVAAYGGTFDAGPRLDRGFQVIAMLPATGYER